MPTIPWTPGKNAGQQTAHAESEPGSEPASEPRSEVAAGTAVVMASRLEVRSLRHVPRFFFHSLRLWRQVRQAPGVLGASLRAQPLKRTFWTLSAWESREAISEYSATNPHAASVTKLRKVMKASTFTFWDTTAAELPIDWDDATRRLAEEAEK